MSVSWRQGRTGGTLLLALLGAWIGHTAIYLHAFGAAGLRAELLGSPHRYMLPAAALVVAATGVALRRWWGLRRLLGRRLQQVRTALDRVWRGHRIAAPPSPGCSLEAPSWSARRLSLWLAVAPLQLTVYVLQENLEARWAHQAMPGLSVVWTDHWTAMLIHAVIALLVCAAAVLLTRGVIRRARELAAHVRLLRWLARRPAAVRTAVSAVLEAPLDRFGPHLWSRPPPSPVHR